MIKKSVHSGLARMSLAAAGLLIATLNLSAEPAITAHIPFDFVASGKSLPAGDYSIDSFTPGVVLISGAESSERVLVLVTTSTSGAAPVGITFDHTGAIPQLASVQSSRGTWQFRMPSGSKPGTAAAVSLRSKK